MSQDQHYDAVIADLESRRDQLSKMIDTLRALRGLGVPPPPSGSSDSAPRPTEPVLAHDSFFQMTIPDAAKKYLSIVKVTKTVAAIGDALLAGGLKTSATSFKETVRSILSRNNDFVLVNGQWGLAEWYPQMKRDRKGKGSPKASQSDEVAAPAKPEETKPLDEELPKSA